MNGLAHMDARVSGNAQRAAAARHRKEVTHWEALHGLSLEDTLAFFVIACCIVYVVTVPTRLQQQHREELVEEAADELAREAQHTGFSSAGNRWYDYAQANDPYTKPPRNPFATSDWEEFSDIIASYTGAGTSRTGDNPCLGPASLNAEAKDSQPCFSCEAGETPFVCVVEKPAADAKGADSHGITHSFRFSERARVLGYIPPDVIERQFVHCVKEGDGAAAAAASHCEESAVAPTPGAKASWSWFPFLGW